MPTPISLEKLNEQTRTDFGAIYERVENFANAHKVPLDSDLHEQFKMVAVAAEDKPSSRHVELYMNHRLAKRLPL